MPVEVIKREVIIEKQNIHSVLTYTIWISLLFTKKNKVANIRNQMIKLSIYQWWDKTDIIYLLMWNSGKDTDYLYSFLA